MINRSSSNDSVQCSAERPFRHSRTESSGYIQEDGRQLRRSGHPGGVRVRLSRGRQSDADVDS